MTLAAATRSGLKVSLHETFDDPALADARWRRAAALGATHTVFQEKVWHEAWWAAYGRGELAIAAAARNGELVALAPFFVDGGMAFLVGSGGSDYLDLIGDTQDPATTRAIVEAVIDRHPSLVGLRFYHVPEASPSPRRLETCARELGLQCAEEESLPAPVLAIGPGGDEAIAAASKKSLVRHARYFSTDPSYAVKHLRTREEIEPYLDAFFEQHVSRWSMTSNPSLFVDRANRDFYRRLVACEPAWLRFTVVEWRQRAIAFHFGFSHRGRYLWYKPAFEAGLARRSPGEVLLRELLLAAAAERARCFDFGLGDEAFKRRFAGAVPLVRNWGLYPA